MPKGKIENNVPAAMLSKWNFIFRCGTTEPKVVMAIPKNNIPMQADQKTNRLLYIFGIE
jgi:hypothetical protein